jgi:hypothetical protein
VTLNGQNGLIDSEGQVVLSLTINDVISVISNDRFLVGKPFKKGVLDSKAAVVVPVEYYNIEKLPNDTWKVDKVQYANHLFGIYGDDGNVIYECKYEEILTDSDGNVIPSFSGNDDFVFKARLLDKYALCSKEKTVLTDYLYDDIIYSRDGFLIVISNTQQGVIDYEGNIVLPLCDLVIEKVIDRNLFIIQDNFSRLYIVNEAGKALTSEMYADITVLKNKTYIGKRNDPHSWPYGYLYDYINYDGAILFTSNKQIEIADNGLPVTSTAMSIGNTVVKECSGKFAIGYEESISFSDYFFDSVEKLNDSILIVGMYKKYGLANLEGMLILPAKYSHEFEVCSKGIIKFCNDDNVQKYYGLCDSSGKILAEAEYTFIRENNPGIFKLFYKEGKEQKSKYLELKELKKFEVGETYSGLVDGVQDYGVFVKVHGFGSGLLHVKQMKKQGKEISDFSKGARIQVKVINIRKDGKIEFGLA